MSGITAIWAIYSALTVNVEIKAENSTSQLVKAAHQKHQFRTGMEVSGIAVPVPDQRLETARFYKVDPRIALSLVVR